MRFVVDNKHIHTYSYGDFHIVQVTEDNGDKFYGRFGFSRLDVYELQLLFFLPDLLFDTN